MAYLYHIVPREMKGKDLLPLNKLKETEIDLYEKYTEKYMDHPRRKKLLKRKIPKMNCYWNDVIHMLPIDPRKVYYALREAGMRERELSFYQIPLSLFADDNEFAFYHYRPEAYQGPGEDLLDSEITLIKRAELQMLENLRPETKGYYKESIRENRPFGLFHYVPHVFYKGTINISDVKVVKWNEG
ncbi:group-specific protein [Bacillus shivajii]|uniref:group-specific protein n=1 Tax=Bacillus shivajii TaxID=1983719 RepID=UPI001CFA25F0|nr:group-specific protein [Bacillus shivajii]UCZ53815.1 group-specific protein [Bacillus shivajii]